MNSVFDEQNPPPFLLFVIIVGIELHFCQKQLFELIKKVTTEYEIFTAIILVRLSCFMHIPQDVPCGWPHILIQITVNTLNQSGLF